MICQDASNGRKYRMLQACRSCSGSKGRSQDAGVAQRYQVVISRQLLVRRIKLSYLPLVPLLVANDTYNDLEEHKICTTSFPLGALPKHLAHIGKTSQSLIHKPGHP